MAEQDPPKPETFSERLIRCQAERLATLDRATTTPAGLESAMAEVSAEVTADAAEARSIAAGKDQPSAGHSSGSD
jgi:hypothetical protein